MGNTNSYKFKDLSPTETIITDFLNHYIYRGGSHYEVNQSHNIHYCDEYIKWMNDPNITDRQVKRLKRLFKAILPKCGKGRQNKHRFIYPKFSLVVEGIDQLSKTNMRLTFVENYNRVATKITIKACDMYDLIYCEPVMDFKDSDYEILYNHNTIIKDNQTLSFENFEQFLLERSELNKELLKPDQFALVTGIQTTRHDLKDLKHFDKLPLELVDLITTF